MLEDLTSKVRYKALKILFFSSFKKNECISYVKRILNDLCLAKAS